MDVGMMMLFSSYGWDDGSYMDFGQPTLIEYKLHSN